MNRTPTILIHIDDRRRDALPCLLLGKTLHAMGHHVYFCNRFTNRAYWTLLKPDVMVVPYAWMGVRSPEELAERAKSTKIVVMPTEGLAMPHEQAMDVVGEYDSSVKVEGQARYRYSRHVAKILHWGRSQRQALLDRDVVREDQVSVVGPIRADLLRPEFGAPDRLTRTGVVGFVGQFYSINPFDKRSVFEQGDGMRSFEARGRFYDEDRNLEDYFWSQYADLRLYLTLIDELIRHRNLTVSYRVHPFEHLHSYSYLANKYGQRFRLDPPLNPLHRWLHGVEAVAFTFSSVGLEAMLMGKPALVVEAIVEARLREHLGLARFWPEYAQWCWRPKSVDEAADLMELASRGKLSANHVSNPQFQKFAKDYFDWPREEPAILSAAKEIDGIAKTACADLPGAGGRGPVPDLLKPIGLATFCAYRAWGIAGLRLQALWNRTGSLEGSIQTQLYSNFYPWHREEFRLADQLFPVLARLIRV